MERQVSRGRASRTALLTLIASAVATGACFRGADVSQIVCGEDRYCPASYRCVVPPGQSQGTCQRSVDTLDGGGEAGYPLDGPGIGPVDSAADAPISVDVGVDTSPVEVAPDSALAPADAPQGVDVAAEVAMALDTASVEAGLKGLGAACAAGAECTSRFCADGVCCDSACAGQCQACAEKTSVGSCTTVAGSPRGTRTPCAGAQATCAGQCGGLPDRCSYPASEVVCAAATCSGDSGLKPASVCDGAGACTVVTAVPCGGGKFCSGGACVAQLANGGACQNVSQCASGNCSSGICCAAGQTACGGACVSLSSSNSNCGSCGRACAAGSSCSGGSCYLQDGKPCTSGAQCLGGVCSTFYLDGEGDGYGAGTGVSQCGTTIPAGYANKPGDCCDSDGNAYPGQTAYFSTATACGGFDYNCDGTATAKSNGPPLGSCGTPNCQVVGDSCVDNGGCTCSGGCLTYSTADCGQPFIYQTAGCGWVAGSGGSICEGFGAGNQAGTQACR